MPFVQITEGTKNYIKEFLLSEQGGNTAPTRRINPNKYTGISTRQRSAMSSAGRGTGMGTKGAAAYRQKIQPTELIDYTTMFGNTDIPGTTVKGTPSAQLGLNYMTTLSKGSAAVDVLDQMLQQSPATKAAVMSSLMGVFPKENIKGSQTTMKNVSAQISSQIPGPAQTILKTITDIALPTSKGPGSILANNKLYNKVMQYSFNTTGMDPSDPLGGIRRGLELMGGQSIRRNVARQGQAQQRGAESTMGHPSGSGNW